MVISFQEQSYFAPQLDKRMSLLNKFLVRSEITSYTWNEMTMERNDRIPVRGGVIGQADAHIVTTEVNRPVSYSHDWTGTSTE